MSVSAQQYRIAARDLLDAALLFRSCTLYQALALLIRRPPAAVPLLLYERARTRTVTQLVQRGWLKAASYQPKAKSLRRVSERARYRAHAASVGMSADYPPQVRDLVANLPPGMWYEETAIVRGPLKGYSKAFHARKVIKSLVRAGILEENTSQVSGSTVLLTPTRAAWDEFVWTPAALDGNARDRRGVRGARSWRLHAEYEYRPPRTSMMEHHLLTVDAALDLQRRSGLDVARFISEEVLRSESRRGLDSRYGPRDEKLADSAVTLMSADGMEIELPIEVVVSRYTQERLRERATLLPERTQYYAATAGLIDRWQLLSDRAIRHAANMEAPCEWDVDIVVRPPLAPSARKVPPLAL